MARQARHHLPTPSSEEEGEKVAQPKAPSSLEEGVGGGGVSRETLRKRAAKMRGEPTEPERRLWMALRSSRFEGLKFRRQVVIGYRIVDFFCPAKGLIIEIDGDTHDRGDDAAKDTVMLRDHGFLTVRFTNSDVFSNIEGVLVQLQAELRQLPDRWPNGRAHHPQTPSSEEEGA